jgi:hypothetical protein
MTGTDFAVSFSRQHRGQTGSEKTRDLPSGVKNTLSICNIVVPHTPQLRTGCISDRYCRGSSISGDETTNCGNDAFDMAAFLGNRKVG